LKEFSKGDFKGKKIFFARAKCEISLGGGRRPAERKKVLSARQIGQNAKEKRKKQRDFRKTDGKKKDDGPY